MLKQLQHWYLRHKLLCGVGFGLFVLYNLAGFVATPMVIRNILKNKVSTVLKRNVQVETVQANPYTFSLRVAGFSVSDRDGRPFIHLGNLYVNVDPVISLFKRGMAVQSVLIENPKVRVVRTAADQFNFSDLTTPSEKKHKDDATSSKPVRLILNMFNISGGQIQFVDKAQTLPFESTLSELNIRLSQLDTKPDASSALYQVNARTERDETINVSGQADVEPLTVAAAVNLGGFDIAKYAPYYNAYFNAQVVDGTLDLEAKVNWSDELQTVSDIVLTLSKLTLSASQGQSLATLERFQAADASINLKHKEIQLGRVNTSNGEIDIQINGDGQLNLVTAFAPPSPADADSAEADEKGPTQVPAWVVKIPEFDMRNYTVRYQDQQTEPEANFVLSRINLSAKNLSTRKDARGTADLSLNWADRGTLALKGDVGIIPLAAKVQVEAEALDVRPLQPYINPHALLVVTNGHFNTKGELTIIPQDHRMDIQYAGTAALNELKTIDKLKTSLFLDWKSLYLNGIKLSTAPFKLYIDEVALTDFDNRLTINADGSSNLAAVMGKKENAAGGRAKKKAAPPGNGEASSEAKGEDIKINTVTLQGGRVDFSDLFVKPNVRLPMSRIGGHISGLDTIKEHKADVLLQGMVGSKVPMEIKGQINPLIEKPYVDLTIGLMGVDLSPFAPYSGKYLGYKLEKGQLSLDLAYKVADNKLSAQNKVLFNQLTLGDAVDSPTATQLPVKLALALLKDRQGNINLDLPMTGDLDDPEFSIGGIVVKMLTNLIVNIVSSPFSVLGALFGGGEELAFLDFEYGQSLILEENSKKLDTLSKILFERPGLKMEIQGQVNPQGDIEGLRRLRFEEQLKAMKLNTMIARGQKAVPLSQIELTHQERDAMVKKTYAEAQFPKPRDEKGKLKKLSPPEMEKLLYTAIEIRDDDLRLLAHQRAQAAKEYLINQGKVDARRLFIVEPGIDAVDTEGKLQSRVQFSLK